MRYSLDMVPFTKAEEQSYQIVDEDCEPEYLKGE